MNPLAPPAPSLPVYAPDAPVWDHTAGFRWRRGSVEELVALIDYAGLVLRDGRRMAAEGQ